jgi:hypothetical protein
LTVEDQLKKRSKEEIGLVPKNLNFIGRIHYAAIDPALLTPGLDSGEAYGEHEGEPLT